MVKKVNFRWSCILLVFGIVHAASARERGPRVEVACPSPPMPVRVSDKVVLAYELHVTNFDVVPLTLKRLEIFPDAENKAALTVISEDALKPLVFHVGQKMDHMKMEAKGSTTVEPGRRDIVFLWVELAPETAAPASLHHRMLFVPSTPDGGNAGPEAILQDFTVEVGKQAAPVIGSPFDGGVWAGDGIANGTAHRRSVFAIDGHIHQPERFAIDWVKVGANGDSHTGTARNEDWWGFGEPLYAVADGEVMALVDNIADNTPRVLPAQVTLDNIAGNFVVLRIAPNRFVTYAHLKNGSIVVHPHDHVRRGELIGRLGNSGNSTGPHLHFQVTDRVTPLESEGEPFVFAEFTDLGPGSKYEVDQHPSTPRTRSLPPDNDVVEFKKMDGR